MSIPAKPPADSSPAVSSKFSSGAILAIVACVAALCLTFLLAVGIAAGGYLLSRTERARAQREAAEVDRAVAAAFEDAAIAIDDAKAELLDAQAEKGRMIEEAHAILDRVEAAVGAENGDPGELRTWTRGDFTLEASFVRLDGDDVILRKADGAEVSVPLEELSAVDQCVATMAGPAADSPSAP